MVFFLFKGREHSVTLREKLAEEKLKRYINEACTKNNNNKNNCAVYVKQNHVCIGACIQCLIQKLG